jgi:hypothetical protein
MAAMLVTQNAAIPTTSLMIVRSTSAPTMAHTKATTCTGPVSSWGRKARHSTAPAGSQVSTLAMTKPSQ